MSSVYSMSNPYDEQLHSGVVPLSALVSMCERNDVNGLRASLVSSSLSSITMRYLLATAVRNGSVDAADYLISAGASITVCTDALMVSVAENGYLDMFRMLERHGLDVSRLSYLVIVSAIRSGSCSMFDYLYSRIRTDKLTKYRLMIIAARYGNHNVISRIVGDGIDMNDNSEYIEECGSPKLSALNATVFSVYTSIHPLVSAASGGKLATIMFLDELGADTDMYKNMCLLVAAAHGCTEVVSYMLGIGADISSYENGAICAAAYGGHRETVMYLMRQGATQEHMNYAAVAAGRRSKRVLPLLLSALTYDELKRLSMHTSMGVARAAITFISRGES